jgi:hypothetical protein
MKSSTQTVIISFLALLIIANMWVFYQGIGLNDKISKYEAALEKMEKANVELEARLQGVEGIDKTASDAARLGFGTFGLPLHIDNPRYAYQP